MRVGALLLKTAHDPTVFSIEASHIPGPGSNPAYPSQMFLRCQRCLKTAKAKQLQIKNLIFISKMTKNDPTGGYFYSKPHFPVNQLLCLAPSGGDPEYYTD